MVAIWSSPLERTLRTAEEIAARSGVPVKVDLRLSEWELTHRWKGHSWGSISEVFPGELEAYLERPRDLPFETVTLDELADRMAEVAKALDREHPHGDVVIVSHQDSIQAARLRLTGSNLSSLHDDKPSHGAVVTLRPGTSWREETVWEPGKSPRFGDGPGLRVLASVDDNPAPTSA